MLRSLSPEQRDELARLMAEAMDDPDLESELGQLRDNLHALRPGLGRAGRCGCRAAASRWATATRSARSPTSPTSRRSSAQLGQEHPGATLDDVDVDALERQLAPSAAADLRALRDLERELERQGYVTRGSDGLQLTPKALRRLGETRPATDLRSARRGGPRRPRRPARGCRRGAHRDHPAVDVRRRAADRGRADRAQRGAALGEHRRVAAARGRRLRRGRDRAPYAGRGGAVRRPVLLDGAGGPLGPDEADRAGPRAPGRPPGSARTRCRSSASTGWRDG